MNQQKPVIIGIAGGTGSGKSTFTNRLRDAFGDEVTVIYHDNYYRAHDELPFEERKKLNYDHPDAFETEPVSYTHLGRRHPVRLSHRACGQRSGSPRHHRRLPAGKRAPGCPLVRLPAPAVERPRVDLENRALPHGFLPVPLALPHHLPRDPAGNPLPLLDCGRRSHAHGPGDRPLRRAQRPAAPAPVTGQKTAKKCNDFLDYIVLFFYNIE